MISLGPTIKEAAIDLYILIPWNGFLIIALVNFLRIVHSNPSPIHSSPTFLQSIFPYDPQEQKAHTNKDALDCHMYAAAEMITSDRHLLPAKDVIGADKAKTTELNPVVLSYVVKLAFLVHFIQNNMPCKHLKIYFLALHFFWKREALLILDNYIKMIQLYKIHPGLCITKMHTAYEKEIKRRRERHDLKIMAQQTTTSDFTFIRFAN